MNWKPFHLALVQLHKTGGVVLAWVFLGGKVQGNEGGHLETSRISRGRAENTNVLRVHREIM